MPRDLDEFMPQDTFQCSDYLKLEILSQALELAKAFIEINPPGIDPNWKEVRLNMLTGMRLDIASAMQAIRLAWAEKSRGS